MITTVREGDPDGGGSGHLDGDVGLEQKREEATAVLR